MIDAVRDLVGRCGLEHCSIDAIAKLSGVAKTTIYRHYPNPDQLLIEAIGEMVNDVPDVDTGSLKGDLTMMATTFVEIASAPSMRQLFAAVVNRSALDPKFARLHRELMASHRSPARNALQRAVARGEVDAGINPELAYLMIEGPFTSRLLLDGETLTTAEVDGLVTLIVNALTAPAG